MMAYQSAQDATTAADAAQARADATMYAGKAEDYTKNAEPPMAWELDILIAVRWRVPREWMPKPPSSCTFSACSWRRMRADADGRVK